MSIKKLAVIVTASIALSGCYTPNHYKPSPEQQAMAEAMRAQFVARMQGGAVNQQPVQQQEEKPIAKAELLSSKNNIYTKGEPARFEIKRDGINIDGRMYLDPEGAVSRVGSSALTGEFTYLIPSSNGQQILKYNRAKSGESAIKVATVKKQGAGYRVRTVTGKVYSGDYLTPTSTGFIVSRAGSAFQYVIGEGEKSFSVQEGFHVAKFQNGDIANTNFILLEKDEETGSSGGMLSSLKGLGSTLGFNKAYDYMLANLDTGALVPLNLPSGSKNISVHSNCKSGAYFNKCENVESIESLYEKNGKPNYSHYYWSVNWFNTANGPMAFYKESNKVRAVDLNNQQIFTLFSRTLGVNYFTVDQKSDGSISVWAKLGFSSDSIEDVDAFIKTNSSLAEPIAASEF